MSNIYLSYCFNLKVCVHREKWNSSKNKSCSVIETDHYIVEHRQSELWRVVCRGHKSPAPPPISPIGRSDYGQRELSASCFVSVYSSLSDLPHKLQPT